LDIVHDYDHEARIRDLRNRHVFRNVSRTWIIAVDFDEELQLRAVVEKVAKEVARDQGPTYA
jgi:hypothetical protein